MHFNGTQFQLPDHSHLPSAFLISFLLLNNLSHRQVRASPLRQQHMSAVQDALNQKPLQLLRDIDICWSLTFLMIERFLQLHEVYHFVFTFWFILIYSHSQLKNSSKIMNFPNYENLPLTRTIGWLLKFSGEFLR
jgi:hypothetical protein